MGDIIGNKYNRLTVISKVKRYYKPSLYNCRCECGGETSVLKYDLVHNKVKSCGCFKLEPKNNPNYKHGLRNHRLYRIWNNMKSRCYNESVKEHVHYGSRGITICEEWLNNFESFYNWSMENGYKEDLTIDRINNDLGYSPDNCRWVSMKIQGRNRRNNISVTIGEETRTLIEWCEIYNINYRTVQDRINRGWSIESAITREVK